jgi:hypothetical protein
MTSNKPSKEEFLSWISEGAKEVEFSSITGLMTTVDWKTGKKILKGFSSTPGTQIGLDFDCKIVFNKPHGGNQRITIFWPGDATEVWFDHKNLTLTGKLPDIFK